MVKETNIVRAELLSDRHGKIRLRLTDGRVLCGKSMGMVPASDIEGDYAGYDELVLSPNDNPHRYLYFKDTDIVSVEPCFD